MLGDPTTRAWIYPFFVLLAVCAGAGCCLTLLKRQGAHTANVFSLLCATALAGVVGAKLFSGFERGGFVWWNLAWEATHGYRYPGGIIAGILTVVTLHNRARTGISLLKLADAHAPSIALSMAVVRIGCFLSGCCHGIPAPAPPMASPGPSSAPFWTVQFPAYTPAWRAHVDRGWLAASAEHSLAVHPLQIYFGLTSLVLAVTMLRCRKQEVAGRLFFSFLLIDGAIKYVLEQARLDDQRGLEIAGLIFCAAGAFGLAGLSRRLKSHQARSAPVATT